MFRIHILPHSIAVSLLNEQEEISFETSVDIVIFSDLASSTQMCSKMSSKMIMFVLNLLFTSYDKELANCKRLTKLKTIGDAYVCASAMFEGDRSLEEAAKEMVSYGISMKKIIQ